MLESVVYLVPEESLPWVIIIVNIINSWGTLFVLCSALWTFYILSHLNLATLSELYTILSPVLVLNKEIGGWGKLKKRNRFTTFSNEY